MKTSLLGGALVLMSVVAQAAPPTWTTSVSFPMNPLPIGFCSQVYVLVKTNGGKETARDRQGYLMDLSQFDVTVSGAGAVGQYNGASHFDVCGCQGAKIGGTVTVTAKYPAQSLPEARRWPDVTYETSATLTLAKPGGNLNPPMCVAQAATPVTGTALPTHYPAVPVTPGSSQPPPTNYPSVPVAAAPGRQAPVKPPTTASPATPPTVVPVNPSKIVAVQTGPGKVELAWSPVSGAEFYVVFGPGLSPGGQRVDKPAVGDLRDVGGGGVIATNVPAGMQEWAVASYYAGNVSTPAAQFSRVSLNVTAPAVADTPPPATAPPVTPPAATPTPADKYLVTITGLRAYQMSMDDILSRDGMGDEVYVAAYVRNFDQRDGHLAAVETRVSAVHGDVNNFGAQRLQAGTKSGTGGIQDGDMIPDGGLIAMRSVPASNSTFPLRIFEGTLVNGVDALLISPSIWEQDGSNSYFLQWQQNQATLNASLFSKQGVHDEIAQKTFKPLKFGMSSNDANAGGASLAHAITDTMIMMGGGGIPIVSLLSESRDRPLGLQANGRDQTGLPNHVIVLTREIIEAALARPALGPIPSPVANGLPGYGLLSTPAIAKVGVIAPKPGIMVLQFEDRDISGALAFPERPAIYQMYIQVERVP